MNRLSRAAVLAAAISMLAGCAVTSLGESADAASRKVAERGAPVPAWPPETNAAPPEIPPQGLDLPAALAIAFARNPEIQRLYAQIGIAQADLQAAARVSNPAVGLAWLDPSGGGRDQTTRGIAASFTDLLLLPSRRRLSQAELRRTQLAVASSLMTLAKEVETAWYQDAGAKRIAAIRDEAADAASTASELAARYRAAGNIPELQVDEERARAARARVTSLAARSEAADLRARLANLLGLRSADGWRTTGELAPLPEKALSTEGLAAMALARRLDLAALAEENDMMADVRATTGRWRLLGPVEAGYTRERETDGSTLRGPTLALTLPVFDQGQGAIAHADAQLLDARARRDALALAIENEVAAGTIRLEAAREIAATRRDAGLRAAESVVERRQERVNFMLEGVFTLLHARQEQYEAQADAVGALRDYWVERAALRAAVGGALPGEDGAPDLAEGVSEQGAGP